MMETQPSHPDEPRKSDRTLLKVLLGGCGCLIVVAAVAILLFGKFFVALREPVKIVNSHLEAIKEGNYNRAYSYFDADYSRAHSQDQFRQYINGFSSALPYRSASMNKVNISGRQATIEGKIEGAAGQNILVRYKMRKENDRWRIVSFQWTMTDEGETIKT